MRNTHDALLERVIKESEITQHPSPFDRKLLPWYEGPWFDVARTAVGSLQDFDEIREFMRKFIKYIQEQGKLTREQAEASAKSAVGYCTGYEEDEQANKWFRAIPDISHPVMGRKRPFVIEGEVDMFYLIGKSADDAIPKYVSADLFPNFVGLRPANPVITRGRDNSEYFAVRALPPTSKFFPMESCYLFLAGYAMGLPERMKKQLGQSCKLLCEIKKK